MSFEIQPETRHGVRLGVEVGGLHLKNPVIAASGCFSYGEDVKDFFDSGVLGGIAAKGLSLAPRPGNEPPRICETPSGMLNAIGLQNVGVDAFVEKKMPFLRSLTSTALIANIFGTTIDEYARLAARLDSVPDVHALELNISCPNVKAGGIEFGKKPEAAAQVTRAVREASTLPLIVKLSPNVTDIVEMASAVHEAGADAVSLINTITGMAVDLERRRPVLANTVGGLSGPAIRPVALRMVWEVCTKTEVPVIAIGGIASARDALEFLMVGARAVQIGTAGFVDPQVWPDTVDGIARWLHEHDIEDIRDFIGSLEQ